MVKCSFSDMSCPIARALDVIDAWWTLLILRDFMIFGGQRGFEDLRDSLGTSRNILPERLKRLHEEGLVEKVPQSEGGKRMKYQITEQGLDLLPVMIGIKQWSDKWLAHPDHDHVKFIDSRDKLPLAALQIHAADGRSLAYNEVLPQPNSEAAQAYVDQSMLVAN
jgi:DNA-binding HxlR family transcriptional regulator|tara:strand:- start:140 stop:634 length:495 start_codon:yes stop_codon:yes gene_type:complete